MSDSMRISFVRLLKTKNTHHQMYNQFSTFTLSSGYMHHVRSYGRSFSSTMLWSPSPETDFSECPKDQDPSTAKPTPLTEAPFLWTYTGGDRVSTKSRPLGYKRVYLPLCTVADTPFHIQGDEIACPFNPYSAGIDFRRLKSIPAL